MKKMFFYSLVYSLSAVVLGACGSPDFSVSESGLEFRIIRSGGTDSFARLGQTAKIHFTQKVGDRIIETTEDKMPLYWMVMPGAGNRYNPLEVFEYGLKKGDSVITVQIVDTMLAKGIFKSMPPWMKPGDRWYTYLKVVEVFTSDSLLIADRVHERERVLSLQISRGKERIRKFLAEHTLRFEVLDTAVFLQRIQEGNGRVIGKNAEVKAVLTFRTLKDTVIRENDTVSFKGDADYFPAAIQNHLPELRKGSRFRIYIPAVMILGVSPVDPRIRADDDLLFEMEVL